MVYVRRVNGHYKVYCSDMEVAAFLAWNDADEYARVYARSRNIGYYGRAQ